MTPEQAAALARRIVNKQLAAARMAGLLAPADDAWPLHETGVKLIADALVLAHKKGAAEARKR